MDKNVPLISVIVPVYNVQTYLKKCVNSILSQDYDSFELILVDDGSTDDSGNICDIFKEMDSRVSVIHKKNGGLSDARNNGIAASKGKFLTFIDSDDFVSTDYLSVLVNAAIKFKADIVQGEFTKLQNQLGTKSNLGVKKFSSSEALRSMLTLERVQVNAWAKLYKAELFEKTRYPVGRINEDNLTTYKAIIDANVVVCQNQYIYFYRTNPSGIMNSRFTKRRFDILDAPDETKMYLGKKATGFSEELEYYQMRIAIRLYNECYESKQYELYKEELKKIKKILSEFNLNNKYCNTKYRLMIFFLCHGNHFYNYIIKRMGKK